MTWKRLASLSYSDLGIRSEPRCILASHARVATHTDAVHLQFARENMQKAQQRAVSTVVAFVAYQAVLSTKPSSGDLDLGCASRSVASRLNLEGTLDWLFALLYKHSRRARTRPAFANSKRGG